MKKQILLLLTLFFIYQTYAQVNLPEGSVSYTVPVYGYTDNQSKLSFNSSLLYTSGKGFDVDEVSNAIGCKWQLTGIPVISRTINGLPDDQLEKVGNVFDTTKYAPGYLYNNKPITEGCPTALNKYPIFENQGVWYTDDNKILADRELDIFHYSINGSAGSFVIDKNFNPVLLNKNRIKIEIITENQTLLKFIRTTIKEFRLTDENGLKYIFSEQEISKLFKSNESYTVNTWNSIIFPSVYEMPLNQHPFVTTSWYASKIIDPQTNRHVDFLYNNSNLKYAERKILHTEADYYVCNSGQLCDPFPITIVPPVGNSYQISVGNTRGIIQMVSLQKKEIRRVSFPDNSFLQFSYENARQDISENKMLDDITVFDAEQKRVAKINLLHSYFIKNETKQQLNSAEEKWARLCLTGIQRKGLTENDIEKPWNFEYYLGSNSTEDFVPPYFFHAKDPWGYYNGSYSGVTTTTFLDDFDYVSWAKVCLYNQKHNYPGNIDMIYNSKNGYAKNGLLKKITNPFGGATLYEYQQNYYKLPITHELNSYDYTANNEIAVGGVHISKIIEIIDNNSLNDIITEYNYTDDLGFSSLWGVEPLKFQATQKSYWQADDKYFAGLSCQYRYTHPGKVFSTTDPYADLKIFLSLAKKGLSGIGAIRNISNAAFEFRSAKFRFNKRNGSKQSDTQNRKNRNTTVIKYIINFIINYLTTIAISCLPDAPDKFESHLITYNNNLNGNLLPELFKRVIEKKYSGQNIMSGKIVHEFTSVDDFPLINPAISSSFESKNRAYDWMYGLEKKTTFYDNNNAIVKEITSEFANIKEDESVQSATTLSCNCESYFQSSQRSDYWNTAGNFDDFTTANINASGLRLRTDFYNIIRGFPRLLRTTEKLHKSPSLPLTTMVDYSYNPTNDQIAAEVSTNSKGTIISSKKYYIEDYNLANPANAIFNQMKNDNILNAPVSSETWQTKPNQQPELLSASVTEFGTAPNGDYKPIKTYSLESDQPVNENVIGVFDPNQLVRNSTLIKQQAEFVYNNNGELVGTKDVQGNRNTAVIYGTINRIPVATVTNATADEVAYTSFEKSDANGNSDLWNWNSISGSNGIADNSSPTGSRTGDGVSTDIISFKNKPYKLSFWAKGNNFSVTPSFLVSKTTSSPTINGWTYYEYEVIPVTSQQNLQVQGNGSMLDEIRLYPKNATIATSTYEPGIGKTADCDMNNRITYYEYDGLGRLVKLLDGNRNVIKTYEYHFKN